MIKINLLGDSTARDSQGILFVGGYAASVLVMLLVFYFAYSSISADVKSRTTEVAGLEQTLVRLQETTKEVKDLEKKRKDLNEKLAVIARLKKSKTGPVRVLDDLNLSIPERAWLIGAIERQGIFKIEGFALDNQTIAVFMKDLAESDYYETVDLVETKQATQKGVKIKQFVINAKISYAGKLKLDETNKESDTRASLNAEGLKNSREG